MNNSTSRRRFLQQLGLFTGAMAASPFMASTASGLVIPTNLGGGAQYVPTGASPIGPMTTYPSRPAGSKYMGGFRAPKLDVVRVAFIGCGKRGRSHVPRMLLVPGVEIVAMSDLFEEHAKDCADKVTKATGKTPAVYFGGEQEYVKMLTEIKPDAVVVAPSWEWHARITCDCMKYGAHTLVEVPMAVSIKELWAIVDHSEKYQKHCMQLENVNYGREELMYLNMVRQGVIGELLHGEAAYIHDLRSEMHEEELVDGTGSWRTYHYAQRNGNVYTTHGLGPVAQYMSLARGEDNFGRMTSFSSPARGRAKYAKENWPADHKWNKLNYECGDINTSIIKTTMGRTIMLQWDETSPRPYSRHNLIQGTLGTLAGFPNRVAGEKLGDGNFHSWIQGEEFEAIFEKYDHPLYKRVVEHIGGADALRKAGHGGMDYTMFFRAIECLRKGEAMDQNVYEGAFWCSCSELSEKSVVQGGMPQMFPDFTRGDWKTTKPLGIIS